MAAGGLFCLLSRISSCFFRSREGQRFRNYMEERGKKKRIILLPMAEFKRDLTSIVSWYTKIKTIMNFPSSFFFSSFGFQNAKPDRVTISNASNRCPKISRMMLFVLQAFFLLLISCKAFLNRVCNESLSDLGDHGNGKHRV